MPARGEVFWVELDPVVGREPAGRRPALVVSDDRFNVEAIGRVTVVPLSASARPLPVRVLIEPPEAGLKRPCQILCEQVRTIATARLVGQLGRVSPETMLLVDDRLRVYLGL